MGVSDDATKDLTAPLVSAELEIASIVSYIEWNLNIVVYSNYMWNLKFEVWEIAKT